MTLDEVCRAYYPHVYRRCLLNLYFNQALAEDVTQDVFCRLCLQWDTLQKTNIRAWLIRTTDFLVLQNRAQYTKSQNIVPLEEDWVERIPESLTVDERLLSDRIVRDLDAYCDLIYARLREKDIRLAEYLRQKRKYAEIAELTGSTVDAVTMAVLRLHRKVEAIVNDITANL